MRPRDWLIAMGRQFAVSSPRQLIEKSNQWYLDVVFLHESRRLSAAVYLGGFVVELLLKAHLWPRRFEKSTGKLLFQGHDLDQLLRAATRLEREMGEPEMQLMRTRFRRLAGWSVRLRYNPKRPSATDAEKFVEDLRELRKWLLGRT